MICSVEESMEEQGTSTEEEDRDSILTEFQAITCWEDLGECHAVLEEHNWDLEGAVTDAFSRLDSRSPPVRSSPPTVCHRDTGSKGPTEFDAGGSGVFPSIRIADHALPRATRLLDFDVEYRDRKVPLKISDCETVGKIKEMLQHELSIPVGKQELHGWFGKNDSMIKDNDVIRDLNLPKQNSLFLLTPDIPLSADLSSSQDNADQRTYELLIKNRDTEKEFTVKFPGCKTIAEVKIEVYPALDILVRHQQWSGWPHSVTNDKVTLANCGLDFPIHELEVWRSCSARPKPEVARLKSLSFEDLCEDEDCDFDIDDEPCSPVQVSRPLALMPSNSEDETAATESFVRVFADRYGETYPIIFIGSLEDALRESLHCRARDRKLLAIYLHHDSSILAHMFCSRILCTEKVVSFLSDNFITWAWDLTHPSNRDALLGHYTTHFGSVEANKVRQYCLDELPLLQVISRNRGGNEVVEVIDGNTPLDEVMNRLRQAVEIFKQEIVNDIQEEDEREKREVMFTEQKSAYEESLKLDMAKAELKRQEQERQRIKDLEAEEERKRQQMEEEEKERIRMSLANQLPKEPPVNCAEPTTTFRIRCPDGKSLTRRFYSCDLLAVLFDYVTSEGYHAEEHKVLTNYPRRDLKQLDKTLTLEQVKVARQEALTLEKLA